MSHAVTTVLVTPSRSSSIENLVQQLEASVFLHAGILYYLDNAAALLLLRITVQISFIAQRPPAPSNLQITPVVLASIFCLAYHTFVSSKPGEQIYSHGSLLVDFIGELPVSRWRLVSMDCLILLLQLATLAITFEYGNLQNKKGASAQDLDAEEQGARHSQDGQDIELQDLNQGIEGQSVVGSHPADQFYTDYTVINLNIFKSLQELARATTTSTAIDPENGAVSSALSSMMSRMVQRP